jgi:dTDP-4-dehydrorhamnose 3,5-epimerase
MPKLNLSIVEGDKPQPSGKFSLVPQSIPEVILIVPNSVPLDNRGLFTETFRRPDLEIATGSSSLNFLQGCFSISRPFTLRGLHYQLTTPQAKLIQCASGKIFDVAVDIRRSSKTFGKWCGVVLDSTNPSALFIPAGFAHGFLALESGAAVFYLCDQEYDPNNDRAIRWNDPTLGIGWPIGLHASMFLSAKDRNAPRLSEAEVFD